MGKSSSKKKKQRAAQEEEQQRAAQEEEEHQATNSDGDISMQNWSDSEFEKSDDEAPTDRKRRHQRPRIDDWAQEVIRTLVEKQGQSIKEELNAETPNFSKIEKYFRKANEKIQKANIRNSVSVGHNLIAEKKYRINYDSWLRYIDLDFVKGNPERGWSAYDNLHSAISMTNQQHGLPNDWNIPPNVTLQKFGERPKDMKKPDNTDDLDSAVGFSEESESEESTSDELDGIDALESKMLKEYTALSRGKALYWWRVGTGTQIFVRYGSKKKPIYRVRAGSSEPYNQETTELVLTTTHGNAKSTVETNSFYQEVWKYSRHNVLDIISVGWKVDDNDEANTNVLASIRPEKYAHYPHTRVLVKWKDGNITLERRGFIRRIANGNNFNGDRMIYLKAKEFEDAYWGYDVEEHWDQGSDNIHYRSQKGDHFIESEQEESDADSESSQSSLDQARKRRRSKRQNARKPKYSKRDVDLEARVRDLTEKLDQLKIKQQKSSHRSKTRHQRRRRHG